LFLGNAKAQYGSGCFFSEVGNYLLQDLLEHFDNRADITQHLDITNNWTRQDFKKAKEFAYRLSVELDCHKINPQELKDIPTRKRDFLLTLLENPTLLEHDRFTDLLWAVTHLDEELEARPSVSNLPDNDLEHIAIDIERLYDHLTNEWLDYVEHLKSRYPFLFSLIQRTHP